MSGEQAKKKPKKAKKGSPQNPPIESQSTPIAAPQSPHEELKISEDQQEKIAKRIVKLWSFWWKFILALAILLGISVFSLSKYIGGKIDDALTQMQTNALAVLSNRVDDASRHIAGQITTQIIQRVDLEFKEERIKKTVSDVASAQASTMMITQVRPMLQTVQYELNTARKDITTNFSALEHIVSISLLVLKAQNDDRFAFDQLVQMRDATPDQYTILVRSVIDEISNRLSYESETRQNMVNVWQGTTNSQTTATFQDYEKRYSELPPMPRMYLIHQLYTHDNFPTYKRLQFLFERGKAETSLKCKNQICYSLNKMTTNTFTVLGFPLLEQWWKDNEARYRKEYEKESATKSKN